MSEPAPAKPPPALQTVRVRLRRAQLIVGIGFFAAVVGAILSAALNVRLQARLEGLPFFALVVIGTAVQRLWVLFALPVIAYAAARVIPLKPLSTALGAAATGEVFHFAIEAAAQGLEGVFADWGEALLHVGTLAVGLLVTMRAVRAGRTAAEQADAAAKTAAEARKSEYDEFAKEAERLAARSEAKDATGTDKPS